MANIPTTLTITVGPDGAVHTDFLHFPGSTCMEAGRQLHALLAELGVETEVIGFTPKPELAGEPVSQVMSQGEILQEGAH